MLRPQLRDRRPAANASCQDGTYRSTWFALMELTLLLQMHDLGAPFDRIGWITKDDARDETSSARSALLSETELASCA